MKKAGCALFGCAAVLGLGVAAAVGVLWYTAPRERPPLPSLPEPLPPPSPRPAETAEGAGRAPRPSREPASGPDQLRLAFHFRDADDEPRDLRCEIRRDDLEREEGGYGLVPARMTEELNRALGDGLRQEAQARGVERYFAIEVYDQGSIRWTYHDPGDGDPGVAARVDAFDAWLKGEALAGFAAVADRHYREHGFRLDGETIKVDYQAQIEHATAPLEDCYRALRRLDGRRPAAALGTFLSFFQDLRYELPPEVDERGRTTLGFRVPLAVLARGGGDCDSKSAAFCALWRQLPARVLLVMVPNHALVAVEGRPGPDQASIRLGNRTYILCEVAGPARLPPGRTDQSGSFEYVQIEPVGAAAP